MGADLYIRSEYDANSNIYEEAFNFAVSVRDTTDHPSDKKIAQTFVDHFYNKMYEKGYFRDNYNGYGLFQQLYKKDGNTLSWWRDVLPLCVEGLIHPNNIKDLIEMIETAQLNIARASKVANEQGDIEPNIQDYEAKREILLEFLRHAVELDEPIDASL